MVDFRIFSALILGAGLSRRYGSDKLSADLGGRPLILSSAENVSRVMHRIGVTDLQLVVPPDFSLDAGPAIRITIAHDHADGLSASLRAGVAAIEQGCEGLFIFLADMPFVSSVELLFQMCSALSDADAARPVWRGRPGNPVLMGREMIAQIPHIRGDQGAKLLLKEVRCVQIEATGDEVVFDIDTPEDMDEARRRYCKSKIAGGARDW